MIAIPPNIESFNVANKAPFLHPAHRTAAQPASPSPTDFSALTSVLLLWTLAQIDSSLLQPPTTPPLASTTSLASALPTPHTPVQQVKCTGDTVASSPPIPSLSQLEHYLCYTETNLGVHCALSYKSTLNMHGIGPDILLSVDDKFLSDLGILAGNAIRLKKSSTAWWNGPDVKWKRSRSRSNTLASETNVDWPPKQGSYEKRYDDGGGCCFAAPPMQLDDDPGEPVQCDYVLFYKCKTLKQWLPVPHGYCID